MPLQATSGAASYDGFGGGVAAVPQYIEDVFSTYLYTGNGDTGQSINNGIDLAGKGGLVWVKSRSRTSNHILVDDTRSLSSYLASNLNNGNISPGWPAFVFNNNGFNPPAGPYGEVNLTDATYASWTFRKQAKFFDIVTFSGNDTTKTLSHNLGSVPGCIIVKSLLATSNWQTWHRSLTAGNYIRLNTTAAQSSAGAATVFGNNSTTVDPTSTQFTVGSAICADGENYVAYLFAHDAGGFGLTGTDNVISCGSFTAGSGVDTNVSLGYEPQWVLVKASSTTGNWRIIDSMRGIPTGTLGGADDATLSANLSDAENLQGVANLSSTGFAVNFGGGNQTYIYIAIRRGPMKVPTLGTSVFAPIARTGNGTTATITGVGFAPDFIINTSRVSARSRVIFDKLRGTSVYLSTDGSYAEETAVTQGVTFFDMDGFRVGSANYVNQDTEGMIHECFRRAPSFFDEVCYTGTGSATTFSHNLGVVPELIIVKRRDTTGAWDSYSSALANTEYVVLNTTAAKATGTSRWNSTTPTSSVFSVGTSTTTNASAGTYVAYLFATCAGVSKVASYTGTGTTLQIDCGFTAGARFVLIKRTDSTGDWYVWDSARGIIAGDDPYLLLNSTAAEVTNTDYVDTYSAGFEISSTAPAAINASAGTFVFLAVA